jgi:hypothetical protein
LAIRSVANRREGDVQRAVVAGIAVGDEIAD